MNRKRKHWQRTLDRLADRLVTPERFGGDWLWPIKQVYRDSTAEQQQAGRDWYAS